MSSNNPVPPSSSTRHNRLGDLLIREGLLSPDGLNKALKHQKSLESYRPLGKVCVDLRLISKQEMQRFLRKHHKSISLGEMLLNMGVITQGQLNHVLEQQRVTSMRFGTLLIRSKVITENQLAEALSLQLDLPRIMPSPELVDRSLLEGLDQDVLRAGEYLPIHRYDNQLVVVMSDPLNGEVMQQLIDHFKCRIMPSISTSTEIMKTISGLYDQVQDPSKTSLQLDADLQALTHQSNLSEDKILPMAQFLIRSAVEEGASALHIESHENYLRVRFRKDGLLFHRTDLPHRLGESLIKCIKAPFRVKWDRYWEEHISVNINNKRIELSVSFYEGVWGENLVVHILHPVEDLLNMANLGLSPLTIQRCQNMLKRAGGMMIVGSPIRGGKSTLLYTFLAALTDTQHSVLSLEHTVEHKLPGILQRQFQKDGNDSFESLIEAMTDYDSDVLMVSKIINATVAQRLNKAALVGKKVFTSLAAGDTASILFQLMEMDARSLLATPVSLTLLAQKLVRKLCESCKITYTPDEDELSPLSVNTVDRSALQFYKPVGCEHCEQSGYLGMTALHESVVINEPIRQSLLKGETAASVRKLARDHAHLVSMTEDGIYKVIQGLTSLEEVRRVVMVYDSDRENNRSLYEMHSICHGKVKAFL